MTPPDASRSAASAATERYRYRASTADGHVVEGLLTAASRRSALEDLRRQRLVPIDLSPAAGAAAASRRRGLSKTTALALFARTVATMLGAGVPLERALAFAAGQARHPALATAARRVHIDLQGGASLSGSLAAHPAVFSPLFVAMVSAGEESGALDESLAGLADHLDEMVELGGRVRAALVYPALMAVASGAGTLLLLMFVVPRFVALLTEADAALPLSTRLLVGLSRVVVDGWWILALAAAGATLAGRAWLARPGNRRRWHAWRLRRPVYGELETGYATARFARALGMVLKGGLPVLPSMRVARGAVGNLELGGRLDQAVEDVSHGKPLHAALEGILPALATQLVAVGEEGGQLDAMCLRIAQTYDAEVSRSLRTLVAIIEPAMILFFGLLVGFVALAMLQAVYGLNATLL